MEIIAIDIETIPHQGLPDECMPKFDPSSVKTGNCGPEKAKAKIDAAEKKWKTALTKKMSLDPTLCQVCTFVGVHYDTESQKSKSVSSYHPHDPETWDEMSPEYCSRCDKKDGCPAFESA